jgi:hypothetical protein
MPQSKEGDNQQDGYSERLKARGSVLLILDPPEGSAERAELDSICAKLEQLTAPITVSGWDPPEDL